ncbi:MAG: RNA polymerase sigma-70 factor [Fidelibacterota bacterium]|nr:MAG: RNA polymerase sigma-70 factor [Candidatus Neomarinimicrobiota bacterium]
MGKRSGHIPNPATSQSDSHWVERIRAGDAKAFKQLFFSHSESLVNFAFRFVGDQDLAEDIVQEVFLRVWEHRSRLDPAKNIRTYLYTATRNQALNVLRHSDVERESAEVIARMGREVVSSEDQLEQHQIYQEVHRAIDQLPERCRVIFTMSRFDRLTYAEIAEILEISVKTVETQMGRALKSLRQDLSHLIHS